MKSIQVGQQPSPDHLVDNPREHKTANLLAEIDAHGRPRALRDQVQWVDEIIAEHIGRLARPVTVPER